MVERLREAFKTHAAGLDQLEGQLRFGILQSYNPVAYEGVALIQPEGILTGWLPIKAVATGAFTVLAPPSVGQQVIVQFDCGDSDNGVITGAAHNFQDQPPQPPNAFGGKGIQGTAKVPIQSGEAAFVGQGCGMRFTPAAGIYSWGIWNHDGAFNANGDISDLHGTLNTAREAYNAHTHTAPSGGGETSPTSNPIPE